MMAGNLVDQDVVGLFPGAAEQVLRGHLGQFDEGQRVVLTAGDELLERETSAEPKRRARLTAAYNRGYRSFASVYTSCTPAAVRAEQNYRNEGATLATEITARFGN